MAYASTFAWPAATSVADDVASPPSATRQVTVCIGAARPMTSARGAALRAAHALGDHEDAFGDVLAVQEDVVIDIAAASDHGNEFVPCDELSTTILDHHIDHLPQLVGAVVCVLYVIPGLYCRYVPC